MDALARSLRQARRRAVATLQMHVVCPLHSWSIAAAATNLLTLASAMAHKHIVLQVAHNAPLEGRCAQFAPSPLHDMPLHGRAKFQGS